MSTVLTIDQGTSGTKALVVDGDGNLLGLSEHPVRCHSCGNRAAEDVTP